MIRPILFLLCLVPVLAHADSASLAGTYRKASGDGTATVVIKPLDAHHARVSIDVGATNCAGEVSGRGAVDGNTVHLRVPSSMATDGACKIDLAVVGPRIRISEESCLEFHGASCDFTDPGLVAFHRKSR